MRPIKKPGPKSKTRPNIPKKPPAAGLGDTDTDSSLRDESFHSPPPDDNITDYNLDFTNRSQLRTTRKSPRAPSALTATSNLAVTASTSQSIRKANSASMQVTALEQPAKKRRRKQQFPNRKEWKKLSQSTNFMIPRAPFARIIREIMLQESSEVCMITRAALEALQTAAEKYMETRFEDAYLVTLHTGRKTLFVRDLELINYLFSRFNLN